MQRDGWFYGVIAMASLQQRRIPIIQRLARQMRRGAVIDVYVLVAELKSDFPDVADRELIRIVNEEVVMARCNAVWDRRDR